MLSHSYQEADMPIIWKNLKNGSQSVQYCKPSQANGNILYFSVRLEQNIIWYLTCTQKNYTLVYSIMNHILPLINKSQ